MHHPQLRSRRNILLQCRFEYRRLKGVDFRLLLLKMATKSCHDIHSDIACIDLLILEPVFECVSLSIIGHLRARPQSQALPSGVVGDVIADPIINHFATVCRSADGNTSSSGSENERVKVRHAIETVGVR
jgi:hypothetical protein